MKKMIGWVVSLFIGFLFLSPVLWMVLASFRPEADIFSGGMGRGWAPSGATLVHYVDAWRRSQLGWGFFNSLLQVLFIVGGGLWVNSMAAYAFARLNFPGRDALFAGVVVLIILPMEVLVVPLFLTTRDLKLYGGHTATLLALSLPFVAKAFNIYFLRQHLLLIPSELEESASMDGASVWHQYWHVALPCIRPALATVMVLDLLTHWSDFLWPLMVCTREETRTVQISLSNLFTQPPIIWGDILACAVLATLPVLFLFRWLQRHLVASELRSGVK